MPTLDLTNGISVVIPFYNEGANTLKASQAIHKALSESGLQFQILVVDDGSTDGISRRDFTEDITYIQKKHSGRIETRLTGLREAKYQNVLFIDARVWVEEKSMVSLLEEIEKNPTSRFWNGRVVLKYSSALASIWETLVGIGWRRISENETVKFDIKNFDRFPKGTGFFLASKNDWLHAFDKLKGLENSKLPVSDDTKLLREFARIGEIWVSGRVSAQYVSRESFSAFSKNCVYRGQTFVDSYWHSPTIFGKLVRWLFPLTIFLIALTSLITGLIGLVILTIGISFSTIGIFLLFSLKSWKSFPRAIKESLVIIPLIGFFAFGFAKSYVLGFQSRQNS